MWALRWEDFAHTVNNRMVYKLNIICAPFQLQQALLWKTSGHIVGKHCHEIGQYIRADFNAETDGNCYV